MIAVWVGRKACALAAPDSEPQLLQATARVSSERAAGWCCVATVSYAVRAAPVSTRQTCASADTAAACAEALNPMAIAGMVDSAHQVRRSCHMHE